MRADDLDAGAVPRRAFQQAAQVVDEHLRHDVDGRDTDWPAVELPALIFAQGRDELGKPSPSAGETTASGRASFTAAISNSPSFRRAVMSPNFSKFVRSFSTATASPCPSK